VVLAVVLLLAGCASERGLQLVSGTAPVYPPAAREAGMAGYVIVRYDVDAGGRVRNARVVKSEPDEVFDDAALQAVSRWRFRPLGDGVAAEAVTGLESRLEFTPAGGDRYQDY
jgi:TonB family protein